MDKLRAIRYFVQTAESRSFAAAARTFKVAKATLAKSITSLEVDIGTTLLRRSVRGVELTADGQRYYDNARNLIRNLDEVEQEIRPLDGVPRGALRVGMRSVIAEHCVLPRIGRFLAKYREVEVLPERITTLADINSDDLDVAVMIGWPTQPDLIVTHLAQTRHIICASPDYLARAGTPREPEDLKHHDCIPILSVSGAVLDRWSFERAGESRTVTVSGRFSSEDRTWIEEAACGGAGVVRVADIGLCPALASGALVPVLCDWTATEAPIIFAGHWYSNRKSALVRVFVNFLLEVFTEIQADIPQHGTPAAPPAPKPKWYGIAQGKLSKQLPPTFNRTARLPRHAPTQ